MDVNAIRKLHLARLVGEAGSVSAFADKVETNPDYISSILSDKTKRNPGDQLMRKVERAYDLDEGSLDQPDEKSAAAAMLFQILPEDDRRAAFDFIRYRVETSKALEAKEQAAHYLKMMSGIIDDMAKRKGTKR